MEEEISFHGEEKKKRRQVSTRGCRSTAARTFIDTLPPA
jgi:hypothetical protein